MNAPQQPGQQDNTHRNVTRVVAYVAPSAEETDVTLEHESEEWQVLTVEHGLGAQQRAVIARDLGKVGRRIENRRIHTNSTRIAEIWALDEFGERVAPLFRGEVMRFDMKFAHGQEMETAEVIVPASWFGDICEGPEIYDPDSDAFITAHIDLEFNPLIDGRIVSNCALHDAEISEPPLWIDPEATRTPAALQRSGLEEAIPWTIEKAVTALQALLNPDQEYVAHFETQQNFDEESPTDPLFDDSPTLEDLTLERGQYLPAYLDAILPAHGYQWSIDFNVGPEPPPLEDEEEDEETPRPQPPVECRIYCTRRGQGEVKTLPHQAIGETLDTLKTIPLGVDLQMDLSQSANILVAHGSLEEREVTVELLRGWPDASDSTLLTSLDKSSEDYAISNDNTWRKWVANEGGDYVGFREAPEYESVPDLSTVFSDAIPRRRPIEDCLTYRADDEADGTRQPPILEYSEDAGTTWTRYDDQDWRPLTHELGVYLTDPTGEGLVSILHDAGENARLRITGTIRGDQRPRVEVDRVEESAASIPTRLFLDLSHRFHDRQRVTTGPFASTLAGDYDERDDLDAMQEFVEKLADNAKAAVVAATLPLHGLVFDYRVGDIIEEIAGRKLSLNRLATPIDTVGENTERRGLQIVGVTWDVQAQQTQLIVEPYDSYTAPPGAVG